MEPLNFENLQRMIDQRYISVQKHEKFDLWIYNYTQKAAFERVWNNETLQCRGLIMDGDRNIVSRPFKKFFNFGEIYNDASTCGCGLYIFKLSPDAIHIVDCEWGNKNFTVTEKMDGSLGISYFDPDGKMYIATRGSFVSDQAKFANKIWQERYSNGPTYPSPKETFLFEIIYPQNRIVVNYGDMEDLVLLAIINTETGNEADYETLQGVAEDHDMPVVRKFDGITDFSKIEQKPNSEGYVVHFPATGLRFKIKFDEYVRLHRILTGINAKRIWEILSAGNSLDDILERVPDEFFSWVKETEKKLTQQFNTIENVAAGYLHYVKTLPSRKDQAQYIIAHKDKVNTSVVFNMLDNKPYDHHIWKAIEPKYETPFKVDDAP